MKIKQAGELEVNRCPNLRNYKFAASIIPPQEGKKTIKHFQEEFQEPPFPKV